MGKNKRYGEIGTSGRISRAVLRTGISMGPHFLIQKITSYRTMTKHLNGM